MSIQHDKQKSQTAWRQNNELQFKHILLFYDVYEPISLMMNHNLIFCETISCLNKKQIWSIAYLLGYRLNKKFSFQVFNLVRITKKELQWVKGIIIFYSILKKQLNMIHQSATQESLKMLLSVKEQSSKVCKEFDIKSFISHRTFLLFYFFIEHFYEKGVFCTSRFLRMILSKLSKKDSHFLFKVYRPKMSRLANIDHAKWKNVQHKKDCISVT